MIPTQDIAVVKTETQPNYTLSDVRVLVVESARERLFREIWRALFANPAISLPPVSAVRRNPTNNNSRDSITSEVSR